MLLLTLNAMLLLFLTTGLGVVSRALLEKLFGAPVASDLPGLFLTGLFSSTIYFNLVSFWLPVNWLCLLPLVVICVVFFGLQKEKFRQLVYLFRRGIEFMFSKAARLPLVCTLLLLFIFFLLPPGNPDGPGYHFLSIRWYETFPVIPGLGNLHGRFAFNPASFIVQAAWSFTNLAGQPIYALNGVVSGMLLLWLLARLINHRSTLAGLFYFILLFLSCRTLLGNMSSVASDTMVFVCIVYALVRFFELIRAKEITIGNIIIPVIVSLYAPVAKLSAYPLLMVIPLVFYLLPGGRKTIVPFVKCCLLAIFLYVPWLARNYIMSGYLVYPLPGIDFFNPDWKISNDLLTIEYDFIRYGGFMNNGLLRTFQHKPSFSFSQWFSAWVSVAFKYELADFVVFLAAFSAPVLWLILYMRKQKPGRALLILFLVIYIGCVIWLFTSPGFRFGAGFLSLSIVLPLLLTRGAGRKMSPWVLQPLFIIFLVYYMVNAYQLIQVYNNKRNHAVSIKTPWIYPLPNYQYTLQAATDFPYRIMNNGVKLYLADPTHHCINGCLPCMIWRYGDIEMRGSRLEDGFRCTRSRLPETFPFLKDR